MTKPEIMSFQTIRPKFWSKMFLSLRLVFIIVISGLTEIVVAANGSLRNGGVNSIPKDGPYKSAQSAASVSLVNGHYASVEEDYEAPDPMLSDRYAESAPIYFLFLYLNKMFLNIDLKSLYLHCFTVIISLLSMRTMKGIGAK